MYALDGKAYLVTGASSGLGRAIAERLGEEGADIGIGYRSSEDAANAVVERIGADHAIALQGDVSEPDDVDGVFDAFVERFERLDGVVINAGLQADADVADMSVDDWRKVISVDLDGAFLCAKAALARLTSAPETLPSIVFVTSVHQYVPWAGHANYAAAKGGVGMLMKTLAQEVAPRCIRVNAVAPGAIKTEINESVWSDPDALAKLLEIVPFDRMGRPSEVAAAVAWLMSGEASYVTGLTLTVDGGMSQYPGFIGNG